MDNNFQSKKSGSGQARQQSLLATDVFRRIEPGNPLTNAPEEIKVQEKIRFEGVAER